MERKPSGRSTRLPACCAVQCYLKILVFSLLLWSGVIHSGHASSGGVVKLGNI
jgi:hypothetical protein